MTIICIGRNYPDHVKEMGGGINAKPVFFLKPETSLLKNNASFEYPSFSDQIHYEIELLLRVSAKACKVSPELARDCFDGIGLGIDFTARDLQQKAKAEGNPWTAAKGFDNSAPVSEFIPVKSFGDLNNIHFQLNINNDCKQKGSSSYMILSFEQIISYISGYITLNPGDFIFTGTPEGVGPIKKGDHLEGFLEGKRMLDFRVV